MRGNISTPFWKRERNNRSTPKGSRHLNVLWVVLVSLLTACGGNRRIAEVPVVDVFTSGHVTGALDAASSAQNPTHPDPLTDYLNNWMGTPYHYGGTTRNGIDCSGLVLNTYRDLYGLQMPRRAREQASVGKSVRKTRLTPGDLVFFKTGLRDRHVGIYLGNKQFVHASESRGVRVSSIDEPYWSKRYWKASRVIR
ncbi:MAG: NlpC/P60 family protein [Arenicellales bacterium WSBS_2016_MAG_OTU3]